MGIEPEMPFAHEDVQPGRGPVFGEQPKKGGASGG